MPRASRSRFFRRPAHAKLVPVYAAILTLVFHNFTIAYINSSFLEQFISAASIGTIYTIGSALGVLSFLFISRVLQIVGNWYLTMSLLILDFLSVIGMAFATDLKLAIPLFLVHTISVSLLIFNLDIFFEDRIGTDESGTGTSRGLLLTLASLVGALTPLITGQLVALGNETFFYAYVVSALALIPIAIILLTSFRSFTDPRYGEVDVFYAMRTFWKESNLRNVFAIHFVLQMFFALMVVYAPLYLTREIGLSWAEFGVVMFFAQFAYVLFEYPVGIVADRYIGEKEIMAIGIFIIIIATAWMSFISVASVLVWAIIMFVVRVGAAFAEVTTESYFFKKTLSSDAQIISFFRITRPLSYVIGALLASLSLLYLPFNFLFLVFAVLMVPVMFSIAGIEDTK